MLFFEIQIQVFWTLILNAKKSVVANVTWEENRSLICSALIPTFLSWLNLRALPGRSKMDGWEKDFDGLYYFATLSNVSRGESFNIFWSCIIKQIWREGIRIAVEEKSPEREPVAQNRFLS